MESIKVFDLRNNQVVEEKVYGGKLLRKAYAGFPLKYFIGSRWLQKLISRVVGRYKKSSLSRRQIAEFLTNYNMSLDEYFVPPGGFNTFNAFFVRKKKKLEFPQDPAIFASPCEARLTVSRFDDSIPRLKVKGKEIELPNFLGALASHAPKSGWTLTFRLCPLDYHRFHFIDSGVAEAPVKMGTFLHSVNPWALEVNPKIFEWNERQITIQHGENYGEIFYAEVGALCVGCIHQTYAVGVRAERGQEKGFFDFGGSTVVIIVGDDKKCLVPDPRIIAKNREGLEVLTRLGDNLGAWKDS